MSTTWTAEGYWNTVLGTNSAADVVREHGLVADRRGIDEWLGTAEAAAWQAGGHRVTEALPEEWSEHHAKAFDELCDAAGVADAATMVDGAIDESIGQDRTVNLAHSAALETELLARCEDSADLGGPNAWTDYWGTRDGSPWRIALGRN